MRKSKIIWFPCHHTLCHHPYQSSFFQKIAFCPKKNEQNPSHLIYMKEEKKLKTTITFEPNITENKTKINFMK